MLTTRKRSVERAVELPQQFDWNTFYVEWAKHSGALVRRALRRREKAAKREAQPC